MQSRIECVTVS